MFFARRCSRNGEPEMHGHSWLATFCRRETVGSYAMKEGLRSKAPVGSRQSSRRVPSCRPLCSFSARICDNVTGPRSRVLL